MDLNDTECHLLIEMGFICHVERPHKFILSYLKALDTPEELRQESWNLANDSLRTTLCVQFKSEVVACGVVYAAARKFQVPLPEDPPWWEVFDAKKSEIDKVCSVLAHLYSLPKAQYISICEDNMSFALTNRTQDPQVPHNNTNNPTVATNPEADASKEAMVKAALDKLNELKSNDDIKSLYSEAETKEAAGVAKSRGEHRTDVNRGRNRDIDKERSKVCDCESRGSGWEMEQKEHGWKREKLKERRHRVEGKGKDIGRPEKSRHYSSRDRSEYYGSSYTSSRERDRHRHHPYA